MDLQAIFSEAVQLHSQGRLERAKEKYYQIYQVLPDNINVLGNLGIVCRDLGQQQEAVSYCLQAVELSPEDPAQLINLGAVYEAGGQTAEAVKSYEGALKLAPTHPMALNNLGKILHLQGRVSEGLAYLEKAVAVEPNYPLALNNIGVILSERGEAKSAVTYLEKSFSLDPQNINTMYNLAGVYNVLNREEEAVRVLRTMLQARPEHSSARHMLAALEGTVTDTAPEEYVVETFDRYAARFDSHLQGALGYDVPEVLAKMVQESGGKKKFDNGLDLGCGTGISGVSFRPMVVSMTGVDLSPQMLERAEEKNIYDALHQTDVYKFLAETSENYDIYVAADVFIYLGRLDNFFNAIERSVTAGGIVACSIERHSGPEDYFLRSSGRYAHSPDYLLGQAKKHGYSLCRRQEHGIRKENNEWIPGDLFVLKKDQ